MIASFQLLECDLFLCLNRLGGNDFNRALQLRGIWNTHWAPDPFVLRLCSFWLGKNGANNVCLFDWFCLTEGKFFSSTITDYVVVQLLTRPLRLNLSFSESWKFNYEISRERGQCKMKVHFC